MQPTHVLLRRATPPTASAMTPPPPSPTNRAAPPLRPPELPLPSALVPPKKRRVLRTPPKATIPLPPPPPVTVAVAVAAPTPPPQADHAESPLFPGRKPSPPPPSEKPSLRPPPPPPPAPENPSSPQPPPPAPENPFSPQPPPPPAEKPSSPPPPTAPEKPSSPQPLPPPPAAEKHSLPPLPPSAADEKPSALPPTDAAAEPAPAPKPRKVTRKVRTIIRRVPKGTIAARKAAAEAASAAVGASQPGKGHAPDNSSRNAAADGVVEKEQSFGGNTTEKPASSLNPIAVCETLLGKGTAVRETLLGKGTVGGGTLAGGPAMDIGGEPEEEKKLGSRGKDRAEVVISERQRRRMTEVFVGGLNRDAEEEDVRAALSVAGEITEVRMIMDVTAKKNKGYCFVRYREPAQARKAIARFSNVKICGKQCRVSALDGNDKIFLGNLDKKWKKQDIMKLLQKIGVENIDVVTLLADSNNPGYNRGFAFLELETYRDAQIAYKKLSRKDVFGKGLNIRVAWAEPLNGPDEKQMQKVNTRVSLPKSVQKGKKNMEDQKICISEKDKTKTAKSERILGPSSLHVLPSSSRANPITGDKKSSPTHGLVQVLRELAPLRHERSASAGNPIQNYPRILSGEKRPFSALGIDSYCFSRNPHGGHERNTYATSTSSYSVSPPVVSQYSPPYHHESRCLLDSDSVLSEPWGVIQMRQACSSKPGMSHDSWR